MKNKRLLTPNEERFLIADMATEIEEEFKNKIEFKGFEYWSSENIAKRLLAMPQLQELFNKDTKSNAPKSGRMPDEVKRDEGEKDENQG